MDFNKLIYLLLLLLLLSSKTTFWFPFRHHGLAAAAAAVGESSSSKSFSEEQEEEEGDDEKEDDGYYYYDGNNNNNNNKSSSTLLNNNNKKKKQQPPNIILFMTDDQDVVYNSLDYMPKLNKYFRFNKSGGSIEFTNYYVSTALCCPSRATIFRGQYCHNTEIYDNGDLSNDTYKSGGFDKYKSLENETIFTLLKKKRYNYDYETGLVGKYINGYENYSHVPSGIDHWMGQLRMSYYNLSFSDNGKLLQLNDTIYQTDFIRDWVLDFLDTTTTSTTSTSTSTSTTNNMKTTTKHQYKYPNRDPMKPFFLVVTPWAPHAPAIPAKRHIHMFPNLTFPRYDSFNPSQNIQNQKPAWLKKIPKLTTNQINSLDIFYRNRIRSLQSIDELIESIILKLRSLQIEDNTYFFYTSDNGQHFGDFRQPAGKRQAYETDINVPFLLRGPNLNINLGGGGSDTTTTTTNNNRVVTEIVQSVDLVPTFLELANIHNNNNNNIKDNAAAKEEENEKEAATGVVAPYYHEMDGKSIVPIILNKNGQQQQSRILTSLLPKKVNNFRWVALLEMYGGSSNMGLRYSNLTGYYQNHMFPNTYQAIRIIDGPEHTWAYQANWLYVEWCNGEIEFYNMTQDPYQIHNLVSDEYTSKNNNINGVVDIDFGLLIHRMHRLVRHLGSCIGKKCYELDNFDDMMMMINNTMPFNKKLQSSSSSLSYQRQQWQRRRSLLWGKLQQDSIRNRFQCFDPPQPPPPQPSSSNNSSSTHNTTTTGGRRRKPFAYDLVVPEPFVYGFPFSDEEVVPNELLELWYEYEHYFY